MYVHKTERMSVGAVVLAIASYVGVLAAIVLLFGMVGG